MKKSLLSILFIGGIMALSTNAFSAEYSSPNSDFVRIKGGTFEMGSPTTEDWRSNDEKQHTVSVNDFYMSKFEVTQKLYSATMGKNPSNFRGDDLPVENISFVEALEFCNALSQKEGRTPVYTILNGGETISWNRSANGYRLPTEAEWEYACRAGTKTPFNSAKVPGSDDANFYGHYPYQIEQNYFNDSVLETRPGLYRNTTVKVGSFSANSFGLYDMHGNVNEWCFDFYGEYDSAKTQNPYGADSGTRRVNRGGGWNDFGKNLRSAYRAATPQKNATFNIGLRLVTNANDSVKGTVTTTEIATTGKGKKNVTDLSKAKALIVYYSWSGNTRGVAREIQKQTGFDIVEIEMVHPYSENYSTVLQQAQEAQHKQDRPALKTKIEKSVMESYDLIIIGYPNWWASIPMPIATFLESYDLSGKYILPFCSHGGGRFGQSLTAIAKLAPNSTLLDGLSIHYSGGSSLTRDVDRWLKKNGVK